MRQTAAERGSGAYGFGIIGAGVIAAMHADAIAAVPGAQLVAVTDVLPGQAKQLASRYDCAAEADIGALLRRGDVDVVAVCVPSGLHAEVGIMAAAAGKHLVVEKPIDVSLPAADRLIAAARAAGVTMTVISQHRFDTGLVELRRLLNAGALGRLVLGCASTKWYRTQAYYDSAPWRGTRALDGGSLMNQGIHYVDLLCWAMGPPVEVTAVCTTLAHQVEAEDVALAMLRFRSGAVGTIVTSTAVFPGFAQRLEISGTGGTVIIEDGEIVTCALAGGQQPRAEQVAEEAGVPGAEGAGVPGGTGAGSASDPAALATAGHAAQLADLLAAIDAGRPPAVTAEAGRQALEVVCAVYQSARERRSITL